MTETTTWKKLLTVYFLAAAAIPARGADPPYSEVFVHSDGAGHTMSYRVFPPPDIDPAAKYPLVLYLHGYGFPAVDDLPLLTSFIGGLMAATQSDEYKSYLVVPQSSPTPETSWWEDPPLGLLSGVIDDVESRFPIDEQRLYVTGHSMGAGGTLMVLYYYPDPFPHRFAAAVPISANVEPWAWEMAAAVLKNFPLWYFHGALDEINPVENARGLVQAIRDAGGDIHYTEYPDQGHVDDLPGLVYDDPHHELYPWLFYKDERVGPRAVFSALPESGDAPLEVCFDARACTLGDEATRLVYNWDFGDGTSGEGPTPCHTYAEAGRYPISLNVENDFRKRDQASGTVTVGCAAEDVTPWKAEDVGGSVVSGSARLTEGGSGMAMCAGAGIFGASSDAFLIVHQQVAGSAMLSARADSIGGSGASAQIGVMIRESLDASARCAAVSFTRTSGGETSATFRFRDAPASWVQSSGEPLSGAQLPNVWMKIVRQGAEFTGYASTDGIAWTELGTQTLPDFPASCYAGVIALGATPLSGGGYQALHGEIRDVSLVDCQRGNDVLCTGLEIKGPDGGGPGIHTATASAEDASGDSMIYLFAAEDGLGNRLTVGPQSQNAAEFDLGEGTWTISVTVDHDPLCLDAGSARSQQEVKVSTGGLQRPGDVNQDGKLDVSDAVWLLGHLFLGAPGQETLPCEGGKASSPGQGDLALADVNGDERIDLSDPVRILGFLFLGLGPPALGKECVRIVGCPEFCQ